MKKRLILMSLILVLGIVSPAHAQEEFVPPDEDQAPATEQQEAEGTPVAEPGPAPVAPSESEPLASEPAPSEQSGVPAQTQEEPLPEEVTPETETGETAQYAPSGETNAPAAPASFEEPQAPPAGEGYDEPVPEVPVAPVAGAQSPAAGGGEQSLADTPDGAAGVTSVEKQPAAEHVGQQYQEPSTGATGAEPSAEKQAGELSQYGAEPDAATDSGQEALPPSPDSPPQVEPASLGSGGVCERTGCYPTEQPPADGDAAPLGGGACDQYGCEQYAGDAEQTQPPVKEAPVEEPPAEQTSAEEDYVPCGPGYCGVDLGQNATPNTECVQYRDGTIACYDPTFDSQADPSRPCYTVEFYKEGTGPIAKDTGSSYAVADVCEGDPFPQSPPPDPAELPGDEGVTYNFFTKKDGMICIPTDQFGEDYDAGEAAYICGDGKPSPYDSEAQETCYLNGEEYACPEFFYDNDVAVCFTATGEETPCPGGGTGELYDQAGSDAVGVVEAVDSSRDSNPPRSASPGRPAGSGTPGSQARSGGPDHDPLQSVFENGEPSEEGREAQSPPPGPPFRSGVRAPGAPGAVPGIEAVPAGGRLVPLAGGAAGASTEGLLVWGPTGTPIDNPLGTLTGTSIGIPPHTLTGTPSPPSPSGTPAGTPSGRARGGLPFERDAPRGVPASGAPYVALDPVRGTVSYPAAAGKVDGVVEVSHAAVRGPAGGAIVAEDGPALAPQQARGSSTPPRDVVGGDTPADGRNVVLPRAVLTSASSAAEPSGSPSRPLGGAGVHAAPPEEAAFGASLGGTLAGGGFLIAVGAVLVGRRLLR